MPTTLRSSLSALGRSAICLAIGILAAIALADAGGERGARYFAAMAQDASEPLTPMPSPGTVLEGDPEDERPAAQLGGSGLLLEGLEPMLEAERAIQEELEVGPHPSFPLSVSARLTADGTRLPDGLVWRVFRAQPHSSGDFDLVDESTDATPSFLLPADDYIVHVSYGLANAAERVSLKNGPIDKEVTVEAGGLRITNVDGGQAPIPHRQLSLAIYSTLEDEQGRRQPIMEQAAPDTVIRLNPGTYHIVSQYGDANAVVRADVEVKPGELTDARVLHDAAAVTFKLVNEPGGEALADTAWTVLDEDGATVTESFGAFPTIVLLEGAYTLVARNNGRTFDRNFDVIAGRDREVELVAR